MQLDYRETGRRIAQHRKNLGHTHAETEERAEIGYGCLTNIERGVSIPSIRQGVEKHSGTAAEYG